MRIKMGPKLTCKRVVNRKIGQNLDNLGQNIIYTGRVYSHP